MRILKKLPILVITAIALIAVIFIASSFMRYIGTNSRVNDRKQQIQERQQIIREEQRKSPAAPDIRI